MTDLTSAVVAYNNGDARDVRKRMGRYRRIVNQCIEFIYSNSRIVGIPDDEASGFVLYLVPRISKIIRNFKYIGADFDKYLFVVMKRRAISFFSENLKKRQRDYTADFLYNRDLYERYEEQNSSLYEVYEGEPVYARFRNSQPLLRIAMVCHSNSVWRRRMATYMLFVLPGLSDDRKRFICDFFQISEREISKYNRKLIRSVDDKLRQKTQSQARVNRRFFRKIQLENASRYMNGIAELSASGCLEPGDCALGDALSSLTRTRSLITQKVLSDVFRLKRGTISSHLYYARILAECAVDVKSKRMNSLSEQTKLILNLDYDPEFVRSQLSPFSLDELIYSIEIESKEEG